VAHQAGEKGYSVVSVPHQVLLTVTGPSMRRGSMMGSRALDSRITHKRTKYNEKLTRLMKEHTMCSKIDHLDRTRHLLSEDEFLAQYNKWDNELSDYMYSSENSCSKIKNDDIPWSPKFQVMQRVLNARKDIVRYAKGEIPDTRNLWERCKRLKLKHPRGTTLLQAEIDLQAAKNMLSDFRDAYKIIGRRRIFKQSVISSASFNGSKIRRYGAHVLSFAGSQGHRLRSLSRFRMSLART